VLFFSQNAFYASFDAALRHLKTPGGAKYSRCGTVVLAVWAASILTLLRGACGGHCAVLHLYSASLKNYRVMRASSCARKNMILRVASLRDVTLVSNPPAWLRAWDWRMYLRDAPACYSGGCGAGPAWRRRRKMGAGPQPLTMVPRLPAPNA
jgi:hypothetical protein